MSAVCGFSTDHYRHIIGVFREYGYTLCAFGDYHPDRNQQVILRHDIDISVEDAVRIAELDASLDLSASYHFLLTSEAYNLASAEGQRALARIRDLGQRIGLHLDPSALPRDAEAAQAALSRLFRLAEAILGELDAYSLHRPATYGELDGLSEQTLGTPLPPAGHELARGMIYRSDSRRVWRQGCVCQEVASFSGANVQLLLHPIWWTEAGLDRDATLTHQVHAHGRRMDRYLASNLSFYDAKMPNDDADTGAA